MKENKMEHLKAVRNVLKRYFITMVAICLVIVVLFEAGLLNYWKGEYAGWEKVEFIVLTIMEVLTVASIPFALKFLKLKFIKSKYDSADDRIEKYKELALLRMEILILPMIINIFCYYLFTQVSFGYMAIIQLICLCFISPSLSRCVRETEEEKKVEPNDVNE